MNNFFILGLLIIFLINPLEKKTVGNDVSQKPNYLQNRAPLKEIPYLNLPLGHIKPQGWLLIQMQKMKEGLTGNLDEYYPEVMGIRNGWLGGDGDGWERGPYWIDGLLPLAYILNDQKLKDKVQPWIEWTLNNQLENGYLGPIPFSEEPEEEEGLQKSMRQDWWPKMVMLKVLQQYFDATQDERVITVLTNYFKYQLKELPITPLDNWTFWANRRGGDNLQVVYWLYNITGDDFLLELGDLLAEQTFPWTDVFLNDENYSQPKSPWHYFKIKRYPFDKNEINELTVSQHGGIHCVNFSQGLKQPIIYYQQNPNEKYLKAAKKALLDIKKYHGQPQGMFGGDEGLHGKNPVQGVEFCSISESMFSLESMLSITGDMEYADLLEKITYNALPTQASDDFTSRQYFQAANQVSLTTKLTTSYQTVEHGGTDFVFGVLTGYPCCTANMHQSWPKFVQNLWYATHDGGVAALLYAPSEVTLKVANGVELRVIEETGFPFRDEVNFKLDLSEKATFPFHLRIPEWSNTYEITINGEIWKGTINNQVAIISREWRSGDKIKLKMAMELKTSQWFDFATSIERGPLVYSLKIRDEKRAFNRNDKYKDYEEVHALDDWNFALHSDDLIDLNKSIEVIEMPWDGSYPWNLESSPIELKMKGVKIPEWVLSNSAPIFPAWWGERPKKDIDFTDITLIPYGCTTLRITEFPVYNLH
jgi:uncharacterized protein